MRKKKRRINSRTTEYPAKRSHLLNRTRHALVTRVWVHEQTDTGAVYTYNNKGLGRTCPLRNFFFSTNRHTGGCIVRNRMSCVLLRYRLGKGRKKSVTSENEKKSARGCKFFSRKDMRNITATAIMTVFLLVRSFATVIQLKYVIFIEEQFKVYYFL